MNLYLGCPIWSFKGWVGNFYPKGTKPADFLFEYAKRLTTVEGNTTFYAVPAEKTLDGWAEVLPETFRFCPKIPKAISHDGTLAEHIDSARAFIGVMGRLGSRLGPMFLQLPPNYSPRLLGDLKIFLEAWPPEVRLGVEVRHLDWFEAPGRESLNQLLSKHNMARVVIDTRPIRSLEGEKILEGSVYQSLLEARKSKPDVPVFQERTSDFVFLRYIGHPEMGPNDALLEEWAGYLSSQLSAGADAYVFCHAPDNLIAPYLCRELHRRVSARVNLPQLPWDEIEPDTFEQGRLF
ncbi:MAG: DUF72 domain-containing protein [Chloroflexi bacterium]|nr:DUF72 domain-containing protein [Chloroflexota bacterium]